MFPRKFLQAVAFSSSGAWSRTSSGIDWIFDEEDETISRSLKGLPASEHIDNSSNVGVFFVDSSDVS